MKNSPQRKSCYARRPPRRSPGRTTCSGLSWQLARPWHAGWNWSTPAHVPASPSPWTPQRTMWARYSSSRRRRRRPGSLWGSSRRSSPPPRSTTRMNYSMSELTCMLENPFLPHKLAYAHNYLIQEMLMVYAQQLNSSEIWVGLDSMSGIELFLIFV